MFQNPQRKEAARLTGCKNFTRAVYVDDHTAELTDWGITLRTEQRNIPENINYIGYRAHDFVPVWGEGGKNQIPFLLESKAALPFEDNYYLKPANEEADPSVISWFVQRENQEKNPGKRNAGCAGAGGGRSAVPGIASSYIDDF